MRVPRVSGWTIALVALAAFVLVRVGPAVVEGKLLSSADLIEARDPAFQTLGLPASGANPFRFDAAHVFGPDLEAAREQLLAGHLPLWTTGIGAGRPLLASQQHAVFFPLTTVALALPVDRALGVIAGLKVLFAGLGMLLFLRALGLRAGPSLLGAGCLCLGAYFTSWLQHPQTNAYLLLPWLLLAARATAAPVAGRLPVVALAFLAGLLWLAGHPQSAVLMLAATAAFYVWSLSQMSHRLDWRQAGVAGARLALAMLGGLAIGSIMIWPFLDALRQGVDVERGGSGGPVSMLLSALAPDYWGKPGASGSTSGPVNYAERTLFIGVMPFIVALLTLFHPSRLERFFLASTFVALLVALDLPPGLHELPGLRVINLRRMFAVAAFCMSVLAALGLQRLLDDPGTAGKRLGVIGAVASVLAFAFAALGARGGGLVVGGSTTENATGSLARLGIIAGLSCLFGVMFIKGGPRRAAAIACAVLVFSVLDIAGQTRGYYSFLSSDDPALAVPAAVERLRTRGGDGRIAAEGALGPNLALRYGLEDVRAHDHPALWRYSRLWSGLVESPRIRTDLVNRGPQAAKALDLFSARTVLLGPGGNSNGLARIERLGKVTLRSNADAFPRAFVASSWRRASSREDALRQVERSAVGSLQRAPVIEGALPSPPGRPMAIPQRRVPHGEARVDIRVNAPAGGYLVVGDTYFRGWSALVDGEPEPIRAANVAFRAIRVPKGVHSVSLEYAPTFVSVSFLIALGALLVLAGFAASPLRALVAARQRPSRDGRSVTIPSLRDKVRRVHEALAKLERRALSSLGVSDGVAESNDDGSSPSAGEHRRRLAPAGVAVLSAVAATGVGAVLGASAHPVAKDRFEAGAVITVSRNDASRRSPRGSRETVNDLIKLPQVLKAAAESARVQFPPAEMAERVQVLGHERSGFVRVMARGPSPSEAASLADAVAGQVVKFNRRAALARIRRSGPQSFRFGRGREGWRSASRYTLPVRTLALTTGATPGLRFVCSTRRAGCGPGVELRRTFDIGVPYVAKVVVRGFGGRNRIRAVLGSDSRDVAAGKPVRLRGNRSQEVRVLWRPRRGATAAVLAIQTTARGPVRASVRGGRVAQVGKGAPGARISRQVERALQRRRAEEAATVDRLTVASKAVPSRTIPTSSGIWTVAGGLLGLVVLLLAGGAARVARRSQHQAKRDPDSDVEAVG